MLIKKRSTSFVETLDGEFSTLGFQEVSFGQIDLNIPNILVARILLPTRTIIQNEGRLLFNNIQRLRGLYSYHIKAISNNDTKDVIVFGLD